MRVALWRILGVGFVVHGSVLAQPALATTVPELMAEADRLVHADDASPTALQRAISLYQEAARMEPGNARISLGLAEAALDLGDRLDRDALRWYELGQTAAERAIALDGTLAHAHFLLAANRGHVSKRGSLLQVSPGIVGELETHLRKALALDPRHARALHMLGVLLRDTPLFLRGFLQGKASDAPHYLAAAVEADPAFPAARLDLAEYYKRVGRFSDARTQAEAVIDMARVSRSRRWREHYRPAAEALLKSLPADRR